MDRSRVFILLLFVVNGVFAADRYPLPTHQQQKQFLTLTHELRCLVCQNESIADSGAPLAADLRDEVYQMVLHGESNSDIKKYMVQRYGQFVLFKPPLIVSTWLLWSAPFVFLLSGCLILFRMCHK